MDATTVMAILGLSGFCVAINVGFKCFGNGPDSLRNRIAKLEERVEQLEATVGKDSPDSES